MAHDAIRIAALVAAALAVCGCAYYVLCVCGALSFVRECRRATRHNFVPPVSILKPLRGADREMYEAFRSHCLQEYPEFEIIFGVSEGDDPAVVLVERLKREFPDRRINLVVCNERLGPNLKVSNLVQMLPHARYDYLLVNDSDIRVSSDYLSRVMAPFADAKVGMTTALYRGSAGHSLGSRIEAVGIATDFAPGVLAARVVDRGIHFGLGSTLAFSRQALNAIGGFEVLLDYLADDYQLGNRISRAGYSVVLANEVVDTVVPEYRFRDFWQHQLRWMQSVRSSRGWGYLGLLLTFGLPFSIIAAVLAEGAMWSLAILAATFALRYLMSYVAERVLRDRRVLKLLWLLPLRDALALGVWAAAYLNRTVEWRGNRFALREGKLEACHPKRKAESAS